MCPICPVAISEFARTGAYVSLHVDSLALDSGLGNPYDTGLVLPCHGWGTVLALEIKYQSYRFLTVVETNLILCEYRGKRYILRWQRNLFTKSVNVSAVSPTCQSVPLLVESEVIGRDGIYVASVILATGRQQVTLESLTASSVSHLNFNRLIIAALRVRNWICSCNACDVTHATCHDVNGRTCTIICASLVSCRSTCNGG